MNERTFATNYGKGANSLSEALGESYLKKIKTRA